MARRWFKEHWTRIIPWSIERSTYVLAASLALLLLFWQCRPIGIEIWTVENATARTLLWTLFAAGWGTVLIVTFLINHFDLFGLRQVTLPLIGKPYTPVSFRTPLPYRHVRHPLYFGFLLAFWATPHSHPPPRQKWRFGFPIPRDARVRDCGGAHRARLERRAAQAVVAGFRGRGAKCQGLGVGRRIPRD